MPVAHGGSLSSRSRLGSKIWTKKIPPVMSFGQEPRSRGHAPLQDGHFDGTVLFVELAGDTADRGTARHGGPSEDTCQQARDISAVQMRGLWEHPRRVARVKKLGKLARQVSVLPDDVTRDFHVKTTLPPNRLLAAVSSSRHAWPGRL